MIERFNSSIGAPSWVEFEHSARYFFVNKYIKSKVVVDAACGSGIGSALFASSGAQSVEAFDIEEASIAEAKAKNSLENLHFSVGDCLNLPVSNNHADLYVSLETIEHIEDDRSYLKEAVRLLKPGGVFICSTPNRTVTNPGTRLVDHPRSPFHVREYSKDDFLSILKSEFTTIELYGLNPQNSLKQLLVKIGCKILPKYLSVRVPMIFKIPKLFTDRAEDHKVVPALPDVDYEYWLAVCVK